MTKNQYIKLAVAINWINTTLYLFNRTWFDNNHGVIICLLVLSAIVVLIGLFQKDI